MPTVTSYPGVYIEEVPSGVRTIIGVGTSITAFVGRALRGPVNEPVVIHGFADYQRRFGGLWARSPMSYAVHHYFLNGGTDAVIVRVENGAQRATIALGAAGAQLLLEAASPGTWGNQLRASLDWETDPQDYQHFNLFLQEFSLDGEIVATESFRNVSVDSESSRYVGTVLEQESGLVRLVSAPLARPAVPDEDSQTHRPGFVPAADGSDGAEITSAEVVTGADLEANHKGLWALDRTDLFNLLCIPPYAPRTGPSMSDCDRALKYCEDRRAMLLIDPPADWTDVARAVAGAVAADFIHKPNAVVYFPRVRMADPLCQNRLADFVPCGVMAGVMARTDAQRGVWKAPAGTEATLVGVAELTCKMTDRENGELNPLGVNCLRSFPVIGNVAWGARTTRGADRFASEWKYLPVRRMALYIEESLYRGTQWVVFEPNDEPLWSQIRLNVGSFMQGLFRQGAFQGKTPREAYLVKCDRETTTQDDINRGIVNIVVGFAPLKPAEFVIIKLQQLAGQSAA